MKLECRHCGQHMEADEAARGTVVVCPGCNKDVKIPVLKSTVAFTLAVGCYLTGLALVLAVWIMAGHNGDMVFPLGTPVTYYDYNKQEIICGVLALAFLTWGILLQILAAIPRR